MDPWGIQTWPSQDSFGSRCSKRAQVWLCLRWFPHTNRPSTCLPASPARGKCCFQHGIFIHSPPLVPAGHALQWAELSIHFPAAPKYLGNYQSILSFSLISSIKTLFSNPSLIKQKYKHLSKQGKLHLFATTYENEPGKLGIFYYQQLDSHRFCHKVLLNMSFGKQTIFWNLITVGLNAVLWLAGKNNITWGNILKNKMQNS